jgi:hypothetical protein
VRLWRDAISLGVFAGSSTVITKAPLNRIDSLCPEVASPKEKALHILEGFE